MRSKVGPACDPSVPSTKYSGGPSVCVCLVGASAPPPQTPRPPRPPLYGCTTASPASPSVAAPPTSTPSQPPGWTPAAPTGASGLGFKRVKHSKCPQPEILLCRNATHSRTLEPSRGNPFPQELHQPTIVNTCRQSGAGASAWGHLLPWELRQQAPPGGNRDARDRRRLFAAAGVAGFDRCQQCWQAG
jgi:hypothetical protein